MVVPTLDSSGDIIGDTSGATTDLLTGIGEASSTEGGLADFTVDNPGVISDAAETHQDVVEQSVGIEPDTGSYAATSSGSSGNETDQGQTVTNERSLTRVFNIEGDGGGGMGKFVLVGAAALAVVSLLGR